MTNPNQHIIDYLNWYVSLKAPGFAVMLTGEWGCGKTFFIRHYLEGKTNNPATLHGEFEKIPRLVYLSLNGISTTAEIDKKLFFALHPKLDGKYTGLLTRFAAGALELVPGGKEAKEIIGELGYSDFIRAASEQILVFDDIERSTMRLKELLGYINNFVEHSECKVVLVGNESEIVKGSEKDDYETIKEKLIGKTLQVVPDVEPAIAQFIKEVPKRSDPILSKFKSSILEVFSRSGADNLRVLKHLLLNFDRFYKELEPIVRKLEGLTPAMCEDLTKDILLQQVALSIEIATNRLETRDLGKQQLVTSKSIAVREAMNKGVTEYPQDGTDRSTIEHLIALEHRYRDLVDFAYQGLPLDCWKNWLSAGLFDTKSIEEAISKSPYMRKTLVWEKLWEWQILDDDEFHSALAEARASLGGGLIRNPPEFLHLAGTFLQLAEAEAIPEKPAEVKALFEGLIPKIKFDVANIREHVWPHASYEGRVVSSQESPKFKSILKKLRDELKRQAWEKVDPKAILSLLAESPRKFEEHYSPRNQKGASVYLIAPALAKVDAEQFFEALLQVPNKEKYWVLGTLEARSQDEIFDEELGFLTTLRDIIQKHLNEAKQVVPSTLALRRGMNKELTDAIAEIERRKGERERKSRDDNEENHSP